MGEWFRNQEWSNDIETEFFRRLGRARSQKPQSLRVQAALLTQNFPDVSLRLLGIYFTLGVSFDLAQAYCTEAQANKALGRFEQAALSYEKVLAREQQFPNVKTQAGFEYPLFVATQNLANRYTRALQVIEENESKAVFPVQKFQNRAACALIRADLGSLAAARAACEALIAAEKRRSPFARHPEVGLVGVGDHDVELQMKELARE